MNTLKSLEIEAWYDGGPMLYIRGETGAVEGLSMIYFFFTGKEFKDIVEGRSSSANDIGHNLRAIGESWTFYDLDFPRKTSGFMNIPFYGMRVPARIQQIILRWAQKIWKEQEKIKDSNDRRRVSWVISQATRDRWMRLYGQGTGHLRLDIDPSIYDRVIEDQQDERFSEQFDRLRTIALNSTWAHYEEASLQVVRDGDSYYWCARDPKGRTRMNGGLINHGTKEKPDWSVHT